MNSALKKTIRRAVKLARRELKRAAHAVAKAERKLHRRTVKVMMAAARKGKLATGLADLPEAAALKNAKAHRDGVKNSLAGFEKMLPAKKTRKSKGK